MRRYLVQVFMKPIRSTNFIKKKKIIQTKLCWNTLVNRSHQFMLCGWDHYNKVRRHFMSSHITKWWMSIAIVKQIQYSQAILFIYLKLYASILMHFMKKLYLKQMLHCAVQCTIGVSTIVSTSWLDHSTSLVHMQRVNEKNV